MNKALPSLFCPSSNPDSTMSITWSITCSSYSSSEEKSSGSFRFMLMAEETRRRRGRLNLNILMGTPRVPVVKCLVLRSASYIPGWVVDPHAKEPPPPHPPTCTTQPLFHPPQQHVAMRPKLETRIADCYLSCSSYHININIENYKLLEIRNVCGLQPLTWEIVWPSRYPRAVSGYSK